jgi:hypothetical protein
MDKIIEYIIGTSLILTTSIIVFMDVVLYKYYRIAFYKYYHYFRNTILFLILSILVSIILLWS